MKNIEIRVRIDSTLKNAAEIIFNEMGMTMSEAIRVFLKQSVNSCGMPFRPHLNIPNKETLESFNAVIQGNCTEYSLAEFKKYIESDDDEDNNVK